VPTAGKIKTQHLPRDLSSPIIRGRMLGLLGTVDGTDPRNSRGGGVGGDRQPGREGPTAVRPRHSVAILKLHPALRPHWTAVSHAAVHPRVAAGPRTIPS